MMLNKAMMVGLLCGLAAGVFAADKPMFEGTWKLAQPKAVLSPVGVDAIPFTEQGRKQYEQNQAAAAKGDYSYDLTMSRCSSPGLPRLMLTPMRFRIFQRERMVAMMFEWNRQLRQISLRAGTPPVPDVDSMTGVSYGQWEGNVLVVKSLGFSPGKLLDNFLPSSEALQLVERIRVKGRNLLEDRITIADPENFTHSWDTVLTYQRVADESFPEDICLDRKKAGQPALPR